MGIESTIKISREEAISRIKFIVNRAESRNFLAIEDCTHETYVSITDFVRHFQRPEFFDDIEFWTNKMLEEIMDQPFYRRSMFNNYSVVAVLGNKSY